MNIHSSNVDIALRYMASLGKSDIDATVAFYAPDVIQIEFPNRLLPAGAKRDLAQLREAAERGAALMRAQGFEVVNAVGAGDQVAIEAKWIGEIGVDAGPFTAGTRMTASFAIFLTFRDGRIVEQRNYDCFDAW